MTRADDRNQRQQQDRQRQLSSREPSQARDAVDPAAYRLGPRDPLRGTVRATTADGGTRQAATTYNTSQPTGKVLKSQAGAGKLVLDGPNVRKRPSVLIEEEVPETVNPVKWLLVTTTETELTVRVGGHKQSPDTVLTLPFDNETAVRAVYIPNYAYFGVKDLYFAFHLSLTGTGDNDWILSYGKATTTAPITPPSGYFYFDDIEVTLYRLNGGEAEPEIVNSYTVTGQTYFGNPNYSIISGQWFKPVGYGNWITYYSDGALIPETEVDPIPTYDYLNTSETLIWEGSTYTAVGYSDFDISGDYAYSGETIVRHGVTSTQTLNKIGGIESGAYYNSLAFYSLFSRSGDLAISSGFDESLSNLRFFIASDSAPNLFLGDISPENFIPYSGRAFRVAADDGSPVDFYSADGTVQVRIDKVSPDAAITEGFKASKIYTFETPAGETIQPAYVSSSIFYFPP